MWQRVIKSKLGGWRTSLYSVWLIFGGAIGQVLKEHDIVRCNYRHLYQDLTVGYQGLILGIVGNLLQLSSVPDLMIGEFFEVVAG